MDNLNYSYNGNRLSQITDAVSGSYEVDFVQRGGAHYSFYDDGSLKSDANEQIQNIVYDTFLQQPTQVQLTDGRTINHYYDGGGKLLKTVYSNGEIWEFGNGLIYKNGQPYQMAMPEGRAIYANGTWQNEFQYQDHLGNTRVSFRANGNQLEKVAETAFDPWGVVLNGLGQQNTFQNRFEMQGKESEKTFGLNRINFEARTVNPTTGIFDRADPMAEEFEYLTPYNYVENNPILRIDPDGMASKYNWETGRYEDNGKEVGWENVKQEYSIGQDGNNGGGENNCCPDDDKTKKTEETKPASGLSEDSAWRYVPVVGSGADAVDSFSGGNVGMGLLNAGLAISDVFLVKAVIVGLGKAAFKAGVKGGVKNYFGIGMSHNYDATVSRLRRLGVDMTGYKHHWLISQELMAQHTWHLLETKRGI